MTCPRGGARRSGTNPANEKRVTRVVNISSAYWQFFYRRRVNNLPFATGVARSMDALASNSVPQISCAQPSALDSSRMGSARSRRARPRRALAWRAVRTTLGGRRPLAPRTSGRRRIRDAAWTCLADPSRQPCRQRRPHRSSAAVLTFPTRGRRAAGTFLVSTGLWWIELGRGGSPGRHTSRL